MEVVFVSAFGVAIAGQFLQYLWTFKPVRVPGSHTPVEPLTHAALESSAWRHASKRPSARKHAPPQAPKRARRSASPLVLSPRSQAPTQTSVIECHVIEHAKSALTACAFVSLALCTRP